MVETNHVDTGIYLAEMIGDRASSIQLITFAYSKGNDESNRNKTSDLQMADFLNEKFHII